MKTLEGKVAVITGGSSGIGLATARLFEEVGARVAISGRNQKALDDAVKELGVGHGGGDPVCRRETTGQHVGPVEEVASGSWGIGGKAFGLEDVREIQSRE